MTTSPAETSQADTADRTTDSFATTLALLSQTSGLVGWSESDWFKTWLTLARQS